MSDAPDIVPIVMPKWGLSMKDGMIIEWFVSEGDQITLGQELAEIDTDKINGDMEATAEGVIRRIVATAGSRHRVQALLAVIADPTVPDDAIDAFIDEFPEPPEEQEGEGTESAYATVTVEDLSLRSSQIGEGEPIVLIHGFGGDLDNWLFNMSTLAEHGSVLAIDLPGHGESSLVVPDPTVDGLARLMWDALDQSGMDRPAALIGHSLGGAVVSRMARLHPERVRSLALLAPAGLGDEIDQEYIDGFVTARSKLDMKAVAAQLFADQSAVTRSLIDGMLRYKRLDGVIALLSRIRDAWFTGGRQLVSVTDDLAALDVPILVIWGADDRVIPAAHAARADAFAAVHVIDDAGHMVQMEQAGEVNRLLASHIGEEHLAPA